MALFLRRRGGPRSARDPLDDFWYSPLAGYLGQSGIVVSPELALTLSAIWRGVTFLSGNLASLPCNVIRRLETGGREVDETHRLFPLLRWAPNAWQTPLEYFEMVIGHVLLRGNAYAEIVEGRRGFADQLIPRHPDRMTVRMRADGEIVYEYRLPTGQTRRYGMDRIHHVRGFGSDGLRGLSLIEYGAQAMGAHLAAESYAARFFSHGATAAVAVSHPGVLGEEGRQNLDQSIRQYLSGLRNAHGVLVLEEGLQPHVIGIKPEEAQLLATRKFTVEDVARWLGLPLHVFMSTETSAQAYASLEVKSLELIIYTFRLWAVRLEQALMRDLLLERERGVYTIQFNLDALARGDFKTRAEFYSKLFGVGAFSPNDILELENRNPVAGGDQRFVPANFVPLEQAATRMRVVAEPEATRAALLARGLDARLVQFVEDAAARLIRRERVAVQRAAVRHAASPEAWQAWLREFYDEHATIVARDLRVPLAEAREYAARQGLRLAREGVRALEDCETRCIPELLALALGFGREDGQEEGAA
ncbi:MAG TPA: phage portal protein [Vicinamibacterales bacterium]|nr:phage portal protein [Vicinamibacterales bacterium]